MKRKSIEERLTDARQGGINDVLDTIDLIARTISEGEVSASTSLFIDRSVGERSKLAADLRLITASIRWGKRLSR